MSNFCLNLGQTAEDSDMFTIIWLRPIGLNSINVKNENDNFQDISLKIDQARNHDQRYNSDR